MGRCRAFVVFPDDWPAIYRSRADDPKAHWRLCVRDPVRTGDLPRGYRPVGLLSPFFFHCGIASTINYVAFTAASFKCTYPLISRWTRWPSLCRKSRRFWSSAMSFAISFAEVTEIRSMNAFVSVAVSLPLGSTSAPIRCDLSSNQLSDISLDVSRRSSPIISGRFWSNGDHWDSSLLGCGHRQAKPERLGYANYDNLAAVNAVSPLRIFCWTTQSAPVRSCDSVRND